MTDTASWAGLLVGVSQGGLHIHPMSREQGDGSLPLVRRTTLRFPVFDGRTAAVHRIY